MCTGSGIANMISSSVSNRYKNELLFLNFDHNSTETNMCDVSFWKIKLFQIVRVYMLSHIDIFDSIILGINLESGIQHKFADYIMTKNCDDLSGMYYMYYMFITVISLYNA